MTPPELRRHAAALKRTLTALRSGHSPSYWPVIALVDVDNGERSAGEMIEIYEAELACTQERLEHFCWCRQQRTLRSRRALAWRSHRRVRIPTRARARESRPGRRRRAVARAGPDDPDLGGSDGDRPRRGLAR